MSRVLVTGGPGFIGRRVVRRFLDAGWDVTSFSLPGEAPLPDWHGKVRMAHGDLGDRQAVRQAAQGCDLLIHLAAPVGVAGQYQWQWDMIAEGTRHVCKAIAAQGGRAVVSQIDRGRWITLEGTVELRSEPEIVATSVDAYAGRYRQPKVREDRVVIEITVDKVMGRA